MATNRDLLKEAIADAKTVKETAIANAKAALEEAFTPYLKEKLSIKLAEMEDDNDEVMEEVFNEADDTNEVSLEELLAELDGDEDLNEAKDEKEESEEEMSIEDMDEDDLKSFIEGVIKDMVAAGELEAGHEGEEGEEGEEEIEIDGEEAGEEEIEIDGEEMEMDEEIDLNELLAELEEGEDNYDESKVEETHSNEELEEAYDAIKTLRSELNEINLLNAKLLYTNKIFRNKSLTESQKIKVLTAFDKATSKKEAQLVYETLLENLKTSVKKSPIQESLSSASKALGTAKPKPIIEDDAFSRMRELAFGNNK